MTKAYYNEIDPFAAAWLRELIARGHIAAGDVDTRSIEDVMPADLMGYRQCHFFAGIGVWSHALRLAGWPDDREVWTGSCPCQPFSVAGKRQGTADKRHLWPVWRDAEWLYCRDGKWRAVEPGSFPLVNGLAGRMGRLRGYGNAIVAPLAAAFIEAYMQVRATDELPAAGIHRPGNAVAGGSETVRLDGVSPRSVDPAAVAGGSA